MFRITGSKGFQMTFKNGWTVSVQFGPGNYCENRNYDIQSWLKAPDDLECKNAEIAAWDANRKWYDFGSDQVKGWCTADEVASFITMISQKS